MAEEGILLSLALLLCAVIIKLKQKGHRRYKVRPINRERRKLGNFQCYIKMKSWDREQFFKYTRMTTHVFEMLLKKVKPIIEKNKRSDGISAEERLIITLQ
jgi:uncharacterized Fe-S cluster-containing radical SAM superfamily protein